ncbi:MAG TPA: GNAT family N-acetyltransferase [Streptosporangiaceae bacterium]|jgi:ribosomal protein S18 acetylase RimI-like enzyme
MTELRTVTAGDWLALRDIRLDALGQAPYAFASTYDREAAYPDQTWQERAAAGSSILAYPSESGAAPVGLVAAIELVPGELELVSMWVRPQARGQQVGSALAEAVLACAQVRRVPRVHLWVTESNKAARRLYERCGFTPTGERQPLPSDTTLMELGMSRAVAP